jgi:hypothetical protein
VIVGYAHSMRFTRCPTEHNPPLISLVVALAMSPEIRCRLPRVPLELAAISPAAAYHVRVPGTIVRDVMPTERRASPRLRESEDEDDLPREEE